MSAVIKRQNITTIAYESEWWLTWILRTTQGPKYKSNSECSATERTSIATSALRLREHPRRRMERRQDWKVSISVNHACHQPDMTVVNMNGCGSLHQSKPVKNYSMEWGDGHS